MLKNKNRGLQKCHRAISESLESRKLLSAGDLDPTFANGGLIYDSYFSASQASPPAAAFRSTDGDILVVSSGRLTAYNSGGYYDYYFGDAGVAYASFNATQLRIQPDGKAVVAGRDSAGYFEVSRFNTNGSLDTSFGNAGTTTLSPPSYSYSSYPDMTLQSDGKIVLVTSGQTVNLYRLNADGSMDTSFGATHAGLQTLPAAVYPSTVAVKTDGKIVVASGDGILGLNADGSTDTTFGNSPSQPGYATLFSYGSFVSAKVAVGYDGSIVLAGTQPLFSQFQFGVARFTSSGQVDTSFGNNGIVGSGINFSDGELTDMAVRADGSILAVGKVIPTASSTSAFGMIRYTSTGLQDTTFGNGGFVTTSFATVSSNQSTGDSASALAQTPDGHAYVVGASSSAVEIAKYDVGPLPVFSTLSLNGTLTVTGTASADSISIASDGLGNLLVNVDGMLQTFTLNYVSYVQILPGAGSDSVSIASLAQAKLNHLIQFQITNGQQYPDADALIFTGTAASDAIDYGAYFVGDSATPVNFDVVRSLAIYGLGGNDTLGNPSLYAYSPYSGALSLFGGDGNDTLYARWYYGGYPGSSATLNGGPGNDYIHANDDAAETIIGGGGIDAASYDSSDVVSGITTILNSSISLSVFSDANSNAKLDSDEVSVNLITLYLDTNNNGKLDTGETSQYGSSVSFSDLVAGTYTVRAAAIPAGWTATTPTSLTFTLGVGQQSSGSIGYHQTTPNSTISGTAFYDPNANQMQDAGEFGLQGRTVFVDLNVNNQLDAGEPSQVTSATGAFAFTGLAVKQYWIGQVEPAGSWSTSFGESHVWTNPNAQSAGLNFGSSDNAGLSGTVFYDWNANGVFEPTSPLFGSEYGISDRTVFLDVNNNGALDANEPSAITYGDGRYRFASLIPGTYQARLVPPYNTYGFQSSPAGGAGIAVTVAKGQLTTQNFGYAFYAQVTGTVFKDSNADGQFQTTETGLSGWTVFADYNKNNVLDAGEPSVVTYSTGGYQLTKVLPGSFSIGAVAPSGWVSTSSTAIAVSGQKSNSLNLGFVQPFLTAQAGGPYTVTEGGTVTLSAANSTDVGSSITKYEWDWTNYTGASFVVNATGVTTTFSAAGLDGPSQVIVGLRVTDASGQSTLTKAIINITNAAPAGVFSGSTIALGSAATVGFTSVSDPSPADFAAGFTYSYDFNNDSIYDLVTTVASATVPASYLTTAGAHLIGGKITDKDGGSSTYTSTVQVNAAAGDPKLTGTVIGTAGSYKNSGNTSAKAFDGNLATYFDGSAASGNWVGLDLGSAKIITSLAYTSRSGWASRMNGGIFQASNSSTFASGVVNLYTIASNANPSSTSFTTQTISNPTAYRYVRYLGTANTYGDVAEVQFFGKAPVTVTLTKLTGTTIGTSGSYGTSGNTIAKATDGNLATFFDGPTTNGNWVGLDLGSAKTIKQISYAPRSGYASRMVGGIFQVSNTANFSSGVVNLYTITAAPTQNVLSNVTISATTGYRYVRYLSPNGSYGDIAEFAVYG